MPFFVVLFFLILLGLVAGYSNIECNHLGSRDAARLLLDGCDINLPVALCPRTAPKPKKSIAGFPHDASSSPQRRDGPSSSSAPQGRSLLTAAINDAKEVSSKIQRSPGKVASNTKAVINHDTWMQSVEHRVKEAKSKAVPGQKPFQPMSLDKARLVAKNDRARSDQRHLTLSVLNPWLHGPIVKDYRIAAEKTYNTEQGSRHAYLQQLEEATDRAKQENRWNDVARHEQSAAIHKIRGNLRTRKTSYLLDKHREAQHQLDHETRTKYNRQRSEYKDPWSYDRKFRDGELKFAGALYQQVQKLFTSSDSEEDVPQSPR